MAGVSNFSKIFGQSGARMQANYFRFIVMLVGLAAFGLPVAAQDDPPPFPEFTFKRVGVPDQGASGRIKVQIAPVDEAAVLVPTPDDATPVPQATSYPWFWEAVPTELDQSTGRLLTALATLQAPPIGAGIGTPRLATLQSIIEAHGATLLAASVETGVSPALALAVIAIESSGRADAVSGAGAQGLMQLIPATAERFSVTDAFDPAQNIRGGMTYLAWLLREFDGDAVLALAGYNAGENAVKSQGGVPPYAETRDYVPKVLAAWLVARGLCLTPPELVTDGCVFALTNR